MRKIAFVLLLCFLFLSVFGWRKQLTIETFPGAQKTRVICFACDTGDIIWDYDSRFSRFAGPHKFNPATTAAVGFVEFKNSKEIISFEYCDSKRLLKSGNISRNIECECCEREIPLKGEVLEEFKKYRQGLSVKALL